MSRAKKIWAKDWRSSNSGAYTS